MGGKQGARALADSTDNAILIGERAAACLEDDLLEGGHGASLRREADAGDTGTSDIWRARLRAGSAHPPAACPPSTGPRKTTAGGAASPMRL